MVAVGNTFTIMRKGVILNLKVTPEFSYLDARSCML